VDFVSGFPGGDGAVRELVEIVLRAKKQWDPLVAAYEAEAQS
jgi:3-deoxy-D-manno-octulosonate 8-phosphate phosphatase KdsC-like HAD superfamily phosphatase